MLRLEPAPDETTLWEQLDAFWLTPWGIITNKLIAVVVILVVALVVRWVLHFVIDRVVTRIVTGVKHKQQVTDTQALQASPLAAVRIVQRTRTMNWGPRDLRAGLELWNVRAA